MGGSYYGGFTKREVNLYFRAIMKALNECQLDFSPCPRAEGGKVVRGWHLGDVITVQNSPGKENMLVTMIHEALHHIDEERKNAGVKPMDEDHYPDVEDDAIDLLAMAIFARFTTAQNQALQKFLPNRRSNSAACKKNHKRRTACVTGVTRKKRKAH